MPPVIGLILITAVGFAGWLYLKPLAEAQQAEAARIPDETRLEERRVFARRVLTFLLVVGVPVSMLAIEALVYGASGRASARAYVGLGGLLLLAMLWAPWAWARILAALAMSAAAVLSAIAGLFIAAGGPDSRGTGAPAALVALTVAALMVLVPASLLVASEVSLRRLRQ